MQKNLEIRVYDAEGKRRRFPSSCAESVKWELSDRGYFGNFTVELRDDFDSGLSVMGGDRLEIWLEGIRRYRGYVAVPEQQLEISEKRVITGSGLAERFNSICIDKLYMYQTPRDISAIFLDVIEDYVLPRLPDVVIDAQMAGFDTDEFSAKDTDARSTFDKLAEISGKQAVWGVDVDPETGCDRIFLRKRGTEEKYKFQVGGKVKSYSYPPDYSKIVNSVHLTGGKSSYPNKVENPSFENPVRASAITENLVQNGGFENGSVVSNWIISKGDNQGTFTESYSVPDAYGIPARTDSRRAQLWLNGAGVWIQQGYPGGATNNICPPIPVSADTEYTLEIYYKSGLTQGSSPQPYPARWHAEIQPNNYCNVLVAYYDLSDNHLHLVRQKNSTEGLLSSTISLDEETIDDNGDVGKYVNLRADSNGNLHAAYYDATNGNLKYARQLSGSTTWAIEVVDGNGDVGTGVSLVVDPSGNPHIAYYDVTNSAVKYAARSGGSWRISTVGNGIIGSGWGTAGISLALDTSGNPCIAYTNMPSSSNTLKYAVWDGLEWRASVIASMLGGSTNNSAIPCLCIGTDNVPQVAYCSNSRVYYLAKNSETWSTPAQVACARNINMVLDNLNNPLLPGIYGTRSASTVTWAEVGGGSYSNTISLSNSMEPRVLVALDQMNEVHGYTVVDNNNYHFASIAQLRRGTAFHNVKPDMRMGDNIGWGFTIGWFSSGPLCWDVDHSGQMSNMVSPYYFDVIMAPDNTLRAPIRFADEGSTCFNTHIGGIETNPQEPSNWYKAPHDRADDNGNKGLYFTAPTGSDHVYLWIGTEPGSDSQYFCVDDIAIYSASHILQEKWSIYLYDSSNNLITPIPTTITDTVNWAYGDEKHDAAYSVLWQTANLGTNVARLLQTEDTTIDIRPNYQYTFSAKAKVPANVGSPSLKFCLFVTNNSGETRWVESNAVSFIDNGSNWANYSYPFISGNSDEKVRLGFTMTGAGSVLLDAVMFAEANPADTDGKDFITGENCEWRLKTSDDFIQNDSSVPDAVRTSIADFGLRETVQTVDAVTTTSQARKWAKGYFGVNAQPVVSHKLELLNPEMEIKPDGHVKLLGVPAPSAFPVKVSYGLGGDNILSASVELSTERPSFELLLAKVAKK